MFVYGQALHASPRWQGQTGHGPAPAPTCTGPSARGWSADDLTRVAGVMAPRRLPPGAEVVAQGAASDALYFLRSGAARAVSLCCF